MKSESKVLDKFLFFSDLLYVMSFKINHRNKKDTEITSLIKKSSSLHFLIFILVSIYAMFYMDNRTDLDLINYEYFGIWKVLYTTITVFASLKIIRTIYNKKRHYYLLAKYEKYFNNYDLFILIYYLLNILVYSGFIAIIIFGQKI